MAQDDGNSGMRKSEIKEHPEAGIRNQGADII